MKGTTRQSIVKAFVEKLKEINGSGQYEANLFSNVEPKLKFWDEVNDFPYVSVTAANESREYLPGGFEWGFIVLNVRVYVQQDDSQDALEVILSDIERCVRDNRELTYGSLEQGQTTTDVSLLSIETDGGLLNPLGIGEMVFLIQYQII